MSDDLIACLRIMAAQTIGVPLTPIEEAALAAADRIETLRAEVERLREAERTAWERGLNAAASHVRCETAKWLTPEDRATPSGKMAGEYLDALSDEIAALTRPSDAGVKALEIEEATRNQHNVIYGPAGKALEGGE